jgi:hypothetical protein
MEDDRHRHVRLVCVGQNRDYHALSPAYRASASISASWLRQGRSWPASANGPNLFPVFLTLYPSIISRATKKRQDNRSPPALNRRSIAHLVCRQAYDRGWHTIRCPITGVWSRRLLEQTNYIGRASQSYRSLASVGAIISSHRSRAEPCERRFGLILAPTSISMDAVVRNTSDH